MLIPVPVSIPFQEMDRPSPFVKIVGFLTPDRVIVERRTGALDEVGDGHLFLLRLRAPRAVKDRKFQGNISLQLRRLRGEWLARAYRLPGSETAYRLVISVVAENDPLKNTFPQPVDLMRVLNVKGRDFKAASARDLHRWFVEDGKPDLFNGGDPP